MNRNRGELSPKWRGGRIINAVSGYVYIFVNRKKYVREHISIAEKALGHKLPAGAVVHHHDRNRQNNVNSNLVICESHAYHKLLHERCVELGIYPDQRGLPCLRGTRNRSAKLNEQQVLEIRSLHATGVARKELARRFGVDKQTIGDIVRRVTWVHI